LPDGEQFSGTRFVVDLLDINDALRIASISCGGPPSNTLRSLANRFRHNKLTRNLGRSYGGGIIGSALFGR